MAPLPDQELRVADRTELFDDPQDDNDNDSIPEDGAQRMDMLMQQLLGSDQNDQEDQEDQEDQSMVDATPNAEKKTQEEEGGGEDEDAFTFRLFSSKPVAQVNLNEDEGDAMDTMAATVNKMRKVEQDDDRPEFQARIAAAAIDYDTLLAQSKWAYPALRTPAFDISNRDDAQEEKEAQKKQRPRKSKKRRDFEKAVASGRITLTPDMRDPRNEGGWPGWPGHRSPCAIVTPVDHLLKHKKKYKGGASSQGGPGGRGGARGGGAMRGRGSRGGARGGGPGGRGGGRGAPSGRGGFRPRSS